MLPYSCPSSVQNAATIPHAPGARLGESVADGLGFVIGEQLENCRQHVWYTPSVIVPSSGDQFYWGWQVHRLGFDSEPIPRQSLTVDKLARAIQQAVNDEGMKAKARQLSQEICVEKGVEVAVSMIERNRRFAFHEDICSET